MNKTDKDVKAPDISIDSISAGELMPVNNDAPDKATQAAIDDLNHEKLKEELKGAKQDREMRSKYADKIYFLVKIWLVSVGALLLLSGFGKVFQFFTLDASVLTTLVGGTTLGVVGLFATVAKYLFNEKQIK